MQAPTGLAHEARSATADCSNGYVGPSGMPIYESVAQPGQLPQCNPNGASNELKPARPRYELTVLHQPYADGQLAAREVRPGCVSYGQWRRYVITASSEAVANLYGPNPNPDPNPDPDPNPKL